MCSNLKNSKKCKSKKKKHKKERKRTHDMLINIFLLLTDKHKNINKFVKESVFGLFRSLLNAGKLIGIFILTYCIKQHKYQK
jgi:hypothetical protein